jgi:addiction module RelE/StbE family toxin
VRIVWTHRAITHLQEIATYIRAENPSAARRIHQQIRRATRRLVRYPRSGRMVPEIESEQVRELIVGHYRIIYEVTETQVEILAIVHGTRDLPSLWPFDEDAR